MKKLRTLSFSMGLVIFIGSLSFGATIKVPEEYTEIQEAIDVSEHGDIVLVAPGIYRKPIDFLGKSITVRSDLDGNPATYDISPKITIIEVDRQKVSFKSGETDDTIFDGFTLRNESPGIDVLSLSNATIMNCIIIFNIAGGGGGSSVSGASATFINCIFCGNKAGSGGGLDIANSSSVIMINCTFTGNCAGTGGAIYVTDSSSVTLINCILWGNIADEGHEIAIDGESIATVKYCDVQGGQFEVFVDETSVLNWESGNINTDPLLAEMGNWADANDPNIIVESNDPNAVWIDGDYHLKSQAGRYDPNSGSWVIDDVTSPCVDAGDPNSPVGDEPEPNGGRINIGAYGGTWQASMSLLTEQEPKLIAHWAFDESDGDIAYDSAGNNDATVHNGAWTAGKLGGALQFNGLNTYVDCGESELLGPEKMTISMWIKPKHMGGMRYILSRTKTDSDDIDYNIQRHYEGEVEFDVGQADSQSVSVLSNNTTPLNEWSHIAVSLNGSEASVYINGRLDSSAGYSKRPARGNYWFVISSIKADTRFYNGLIDDVRIYNYVLSEDEIEALAH